MATGLLFGLFPALTSTRPDLVTILRDNSGRTSSSTRGAARFRTSLVTAQIALSMALLVPAGLFIKSLAKVSRVDLGVATDGVITFRISPVLNGYSSERSAQLFEQVEDRLAALPGVRGIAGALVPVIAGDEWNSPMNVQGFTRTPDIDAFGWFNAVGPGFFRLLDVPLVAGREFTRADALGAPRVAVVNETFTRKFGLGKNAAGKMIGVGDSLNMQIIGVVKDAKNNSVKQVIPPVYFVPYRQQVTSGSVGWLTFYVRSSLPAETLGPEIRGVIRGLDRDLPIEDFKTFTQQIHENVYMDRLISTLSAAFAALATLLAAIGLYGVLAYSVAQRTKEIGVRMALGAGSPAILRMVLAHVAVMTVIGVALGAAAAYGIGRGAASLLYEMPGHDVFVMVASAVALAVVALIAGCVPALRASRVDPIQALRYE